MIHVVKEKHLNDFKIVHCVKPKDLYSRLGHRQPNLNFDSSDEPVPVNQSKIDALQFLLSDYDSFMEKEAQRESAGADAQPQGDDEPKD